MAATSKKVFEVFVSKIPWTVAGKEMREYFGQFGSVKKCLLPFIASVVACACSAEVTMIFRSIKERFPNKDKETGFHRGFCWIGFSTEEGLNNALQKDPHVLEGAKLQVQRNRRPFTGQKSNKDVVYD